MKRFLAFALIMMLSFTIADAQFQSGTIQDYVDAYNSRIDNAPSALKSVLGDERVNIEIIQTDGSILRTGFVVEQARVEDVVAGGVSDPTITVVTTENAINNIKRSDNPIATFQEERDVGQVRIQGNTLETRLKLGALLSSSSVIEYFYNIFFG